MVNSHACMMAMDHTHLQYTIKEHGVEDDPIVIKLYMENIVDSCLNAWFHDRDPGRAASGVLLSTPSEREIERCTRNMQAMIYQRIQHEVDLQKNERWPNRFDENLGRQRGNLPERYDIHSD